MCRDCGALIGAQERHCSACGAAAGVAAPPAPHQSGGDRRAPVDPETHRFLRAIIARPAPFTFIFLTACVFLFLLMMLSGGTKDSGVLLAYGAKRNDLIDAGQWWRLVTPIFLHGGPSVGGFPLGIVHLLVNMYGLFMLGPYVEKLYGSAKFVVFWILTGIAGNAASYLTVRPALAEGALGQVLFKSFDVASVGASGALFGLVGVLFVFGLKFRKELPEGFKRAFGTGMLPMIAINLLIGFTIPIIDNAAHLGGLVSGMLLALFVHYKRPGERARVALAWRIPQGLALALVVVSFAQIARHFDAPAPSLTNARENLNFFGGPNTEAFVAAMNDGQNAFAQTVGGNRAAAGPAIEQLSRAPSLNKNADALRVELANLLGRALTLTNAPPSQERATQRARQQAFKKLLADREDWEQRFNQWVAAEGRTYGIAIADPSPQPAASESNGQRSDGPAPDGAKSTNADDVRPAPPSNDPDAGSTAR